MYLEFPIEELPHHVPVPSAWMQKIFIKKQVSLIKITGIELLRLRAISGQIEDSKIKKIYLIAVLDREIKSFKCLCTCFGRGSKKQINIRGNPCLFQLLQGS